jgi:hypothetical protein
MGGVWASGWSGPRLWRSLGVSAVMVLVLGAAEPSTSSEPSSPEYVAAEACNWLFPEIFYYVPRVTDPADAPLLQQTAVSLDSIIRELESSLDPSDDPDWRVATSFGKEAAEVWASVDPSSDSGAYTEARLHGWALFTRMVSTFGELGVRPCRALR